MKRSFLIAILWFICYNMYMKYVIDNREYTVNIIRKNNKNTYLRVKKDNVIEVTTSYFATNKQIIKLIRNNEQAIIRMQEKLQKREERQEGFYYLGKLYQIILVPTFEEMEWTDNQIFVNKMETLNKWLVKETKRTFEERLNIIYPLFQEDIPYPTLKIRKMTSRWGVCNRVKKTVTLNSELIKYGIEQIDYVIVHELSHFVHFDHSKAFWETVVKYCPNYKRIRKSLKEG